MNRASKPASATPPAVEIARSSGANPVTSNGTRFGSPPSSRSSDEAIGGSPARRSALARDCAPTPIFRRSAASSRSGRKSISSAPPRPDPAPRGSAGRSHRSRRPRAHAPSRSPPLGRSAPRPRPQSASAARQRIWCGRRPTKHAPRRYWPVATARPRSLGAQDTGPNTVRPKPRPGASAQGQQRRRRPHQHRPGRRGERQCLFLPSHPAMPRPELDPEAGQTGQPGAQQRTGFEGDREYPSGTADEGRLP